MSRNRPIVLGGVGTALSVDVLLKASLQVDQASENIVNFCVVSKYRSMNAGSCAQEALCMFHGSAPPFDLLVVHVK